MARIGFDLDGVVLDYTGALKEHSTINPNQPGPFTYAMVEPRWFVDKEHWWATHLEVMEDCETMALLDPTIVEAIDKCHAIGWEAVGISARDEHYLGATLRELKTHGVEFDDLIHTGHNTPKSEFGLAALLEDHPDTVLEEGDTTMVLRVQPYNQQVVDKVPCVHSCMEFVNFVERELGI